VGLGRVAALAVTLLAPGLAHADDLPALESTIRRACDERDRTTAVRADLMEEAGALADEIAQLKTRTEPGARAGRELEEDMKRFDRVAARLDDVDAKTAEQNRAIAAARRRFEDAAAAETARLTAEADRSRIGQIARQLDSIEEMRRRVFALVAPPPEFRPVLDVAPAPGDGAAEIATKLQLIEAERERVARRIGELGGEDEVLGARILLKRQLLAGLESAGRAAGPDLALLRREADDAMEALGALSARRDVLAREKQDLQQALRGLDGRSEDFRTRLRSLQSKGDQS
jgi:chromosome segregation ATPase